MTTKQPQTELYELWDTQAEESRAIQRMTPLEAGLLNAELRLNGETVRWVQTDNDEVA